LKLLRLRQIRGLNEILNSLNFKNLQTLTLLKEVETDFDYVDDETLKILSNLSNLKNLYIKEGNITKIGIQILLKMKLNTLVVRENLPVITTVENIFKDSEMKTVIFL